MVAEIARGTPKKHPSSISTSLRWLAVALRVASNLDFHLATFEHPTIHWTWNHFHCPVTSWIHWLSVGTCKNRFTKWQAATATPTTLATFSLAVLFWFSWNFLTTFHADVISCAEQNPTWQHDHWFEDTCRQRVLLHVSSKIFLCLLSTSRDWMT